VVRGFEVGGVDYIPKPFRHEEVRARVRHALLTKRLLDLHREQQEKAERELRTAHDLQMGLMPRSTPVVAGFRLAGQCLPAEQVGGDLFQYYPLPDGQVMVCLADVTGHAMAAAIPVVLFNGMLTTQIELASGPGDLCTRLDAAVRRNLDRRTLVCFAAGQLDPAHRRLRLSNAGCPYPLHYRASTDSVCELSSGQAYPLGAGSPQEHTAYEVTLEPGDRVALFSDGIMEAEDARGAPFGFERTIAAMHRACAEGRDADGVIAALFAEVEGFAQGAARTDDQTAVVIEAVAR
jgi:sigma-B regulation protein RsbU (phosphoserine phosphatase)